MDDRDLLCSKCWHEIHEDAFYILYKTDNGSIQVWHHKCKSLSIKGFVFYHIGDVITYSHAVIDTDKWRSIVSISHDTMPIFANLRKAATTPLLAVLYRRLGRWLDSDPEWGVKSPDATRYNIIRLMHTITPIPADAVLSRACKQLMRAASLSVLNSVVYSTDENPMHAQYVSTKQIDILRATPAEVKADISSGMCRVVDSYIVRY